MRSPHAVDGHRRVLRLPGARRAVIASCLCRLTYGAFGLAVIYLVEQASGSFAVAGVSIAAYSVASLSAPLKTRLIDGHGRRYGVAVFGAAYAAALALLVVFDLLGAHNAGVFVVLSGAAGLAAPPIGPVMRSRWAALTTDDAGRQQAYALDVAGEDAMFAAGPLVVAAAVAANGAVLAVLVSASLMIAGVVTMTTLPHTRPLPAPPEGPAQPAQLLRPLRQPAVIALVVIVALVSAGTGVVDAATAARALGDHHPAPPVVSWPPWRRAASPEALAGAGSVIADRSGFSSPSVPSSSPAPWPPALASLASACSAPCCS